MKNNCNLSTYNLINQTSIYDNNIILNKNNCNYYDINNNYFDLKYDDFNKLLIIDDNNLNKIDFNKLLIDNNLSTIKNNNTINLNTDIITENNNYQFAPFLLWKNNDKNPFNLNNNIILNNDNYIDLMKIAFYSLENIDFLQKSIIIKVYIDTNKNIILKKQKYEVIIQIMNSFWTNNCNFLPYNYKNQIENLNNLIINYSTSYLIKEAYFYLNYLNDKENRSFLDIPLNTKLNRNT